MIFTYFIDRKLKGALRGQFCLNKKNQYSSLANCEQSPVPINFSILGNEASIIPKLFTKSNVVSIANIPSNS